MVYERICVAMDTSSLTSTVYERALETAKRHQAELRFLHCVEAEINSLGASKVSIAETSFGANDLSPSSVNFPVTQQALETRLTEAKHWLQKYCQTAEQEGVKATFEAVMGNPEHQVCDLAQTWQADLIIAGCHGRTDLTEFLLGSVSDHIVHHAHCSVLLVQGESAVSGNFT